MPACILICRALLAVLVCVSHVVCLVLRDVRSLHTVDRTSVVVDVALVREHELSRRRAHGSHGGADIATR